MKINVWNTYKDRYEISKLENARILESWFHTNNKTLIDGGAVYTGSITAEKLNIGMNPNLMADGLDSFEQYPDGQITNWTIGTQSSAFISSEKGYDGKKSLKIISKSDTDSQNTFVYIGHTTNTRHTAEANKNYIFSFYAMSTVAVDVPLYIATPMRTANGQTNLWENAKTYTIKANSGWTRYFILLPKKNVATDYASMYLRIVKAFPANQAVYVDAIQWEEVPDSVTEPSPFKPAGTTVIHGGNITAGSITFNSSNYGGVAIDGNGMLISHAKSTISMNGNKGLEIVRKSDNKKVFYVDGVGDVVIDGKVTIGSNTSFESGYDPTKVKVGGSNVVVNSAFLGGTLDGWTSWGVPARLWVDRQGTIKDSPNCVSMEVNNTNQGLKQDVKLTVGQTYTISTWVWCKSGATEKPVLMMSGASTGYPYVQGTVFDQWERISMTYVAKNVDNTIYLGRNGTAGSGVYSFVSVQIEEGNVLTDWKPSFKDGDIAVSGLNDALNNITIGGKNLLLQSNASVTTTNYLVNSYTLTEDWVAGQEYTFVIKGSLTANQIWGLWMNGSATRVAEVKSTYINGILYATFKAIAPTNDGFKRLLNLYNTPSNTTNATVEWVALYKGNKAMDWTPAPEDVTNSINDINVGGTNLLSNSGFNPPTGWSNNTAIEKYTENTNALRLARTNFAAGNPRYQLATTPVVTERKAGTYYTLSAYVYVYSSAALVGGNANSFSARFFKETDGSLSDLIVLDLSTIEKDKWVRVSGTARLPFDIRSNVEIMLSINQNGSFKIAQPKFELGNRVTGWSPAPDDVFNIEIGGRNLLLNSQFPNINSNNAPIYPVDVYQQTEGNVKFLRVKNSKKGTDTTTYSVFNTLPFTTMTASLSGRQVTFSHKVRASKAVDMKLMALVYGGTEIRMFDYDKVFSINTSWSTVSTTFNMPSNLVANGNLGVRFILSSPTTTQPDLYVDYREWQIEFGAKATDWNPAPEDVQGLYDTLNDDYATNKINWNNIQTVVNTWKGSAVGGTTMINGGLIQTNTITAEKIAVGDFTNYATNPQFMDGTNIGWTSNVAAVANTLGGPTKFLGRTQARDSYVENWMPVRPGDKFYVSADVYTADSTLDIGIGMNFAATDGASPIWTCVYQKPTGSKWVRVSGEVQLPAGNVQTKARVFVQINGAAPFGSWYFTNVEVRKKNTGELIVDGTIMGKHLVSDTITAREIAARTITATQIAAGTLTANEIAANSISADKMRIGSFENLYTNGSFELGDVNWVGNSGTTYQILKDAATAYKGNWYMRIPHDGKFNDIFDTNPIDVLAGERYYFEGYARTLTGTASTRVFIIQWLNKDGGIITHNYPTEALTTTWKKITYALDVPADAVKMKIGASVGALTTAGQYTLFCNLFAKRMMSGELIVDGTIWANKIGANAITVDKLNVNNIFGNSAVVQKIQAVDISANRIVSGNLEVGGSQLFTGTAWSVSGLPTNKSAGLDLGMQTDSGEDYLVLAQATANELFAYLKRVPLVGGKKITVSYDYNLDSNVKGIDVWVLASKSVATEANSYQTGFDYQYNTADTLYDERTDLGGGWMRVRKTHVLANDVKSAFIRIDMNGVNNAVRGNTRVRSLMVNYGNMALDWQPHSDEDISIGAINARHIAANSITAREIKANSITANEIAAGTITANELSVLTKQLVNNFSMTKSLTNYGNLHVCSLVNDPKGTKGTVMKMTTPLDLQIQSDFFEVNPAKSYRFKVSAYIPVTTATTSIYFGLYVFNENKVEIPMMKWQQSTLTLSSPAGNPYFTYPSGGGLDKFKSGWVDMEGILTAVGTEIPAAIPANKNVDFTFLMPPDARYAKIRFFHHYSKTSVDSYWAHPSVTEIDSGMITFDQAQGGTLKLGTSTGNGFLQVVKQGVNSTETVGQIDETGAYFPKIQSDQIIGNVVTTEPGWKAVHFDLVNGNDNNDGTRAKPKRNVQAYLDNMGKYIEVGVEIYIINGTLDSLLRVRGFHGPGYINIRGNSPSSYTTVNAGIQMTGLACRATVRDFIFKAGDNYQDAGEGSMLMLDNAVEVSIDNNKFYGNKKVSKIISITHHSFGRLENIEMYDSTDRGLSVAFFGHAYIGKNCKGGRIPTAIFGAENATIQGPYDMDNKRNYTRWDGAVWRYDYSNIGGYSRDGERWQSDIWNIDYGEATPPPPPPPSEYVREWASQGGANWSASGYWDDENYVKQGNWGYGDRTGIWWFGDDMANTLRGKTILDAQIYITRASKGGNSGSREAQIRAHQHPSKPGGAPGVSNEFVSAWFTWGEGKWVSITSFVQQKIANGVDRGFGLYIGGSQANYMAFDTSAKVWVKYK